MACSKLQMATRQLCLSPNLSLILKRLKSGGKCSDACCGPRKDCKLRPCQDKEKDCCYATCRRPDCIPFKFTKSIKCERNPCSLYPRFDWLYYRKSDKAKRQYQKTWCDCPPSIQTRCVMCGDIPEFPPMQKRGPSRDECRAPTACEKHKGKFEMLCKKASKSKCPYQMAPCCDVGRRPPKCLKEKKLDCKKICCPYPAYSECCVMGFAKLPHRAWQCFCLDPPPMCIVNRELQKQRLLKKT